MVTPAARREAAAHLREVHGVSQRRACQALGVDRSSVRYRGRRPDDGLIRSRLREIAAVRRRFGYRRLHVLLQREGVLLNHKKLRRLYAEERLQVRRRGGHKRALGSRAPLALPQAPNQRWSLDFLHDQMSDGRRQLQPDRQTMTERMVLAVFRSKELHEGLNATRTQTRRSDLSVQAIFECLTRGEIVHGDAHRVSNVKNLFTLGKLHRDRRG